MSEALPREEVLGQVQPSPPLDLRAMIAKQYQGVDPYDNPQGAYCNFHAEWTDYTYGKYKKVLTYIDLLSDQMAWETPHEKFEELRKIAFGNMLQTVLQQLLSKTHRHLLAALFQSQVLDESIGYAVTADGDLVSTYLIPSEE